jgi:hypothetical protein
MQLRFGYLRGSLPEEAWKKKAQELEKKMFFHRDAFELSTTMANTTRMLRREECFYEAGRLKQTVTTVLQLKNRFQEQKDDLCSWYGYSKKPVLLWVGCRTNYSGVPKYY